MGRDGLRELSTIPILTNISMDMVIEMCGTLRHMERRKGGLTAAFRAAGAKVLKFDIVDGAEFDLSHRAVQLHVLQLFRQHR
eukprot:6338276-Karenia_brevis.AAC.1